MKSQITPIRLHPSELEMLDRIRLSVRGAEVSRSEMVRLLIHREHNRRTTGKSIVPAAAYETEHRVGRPSKAE